MKKLVAHHEIMGRVHELEQVRAERVDELATDSLGALVKRLLGSFVVAAEAPNSAPDWKTIVPDTLAVGYRIKLQMSAADYAQTKADLNDLIALRNGLAHHFIDRFNLWCTDGCAAARVYLNECYGRIDGHFERLRRWAYVMEKSRALMADLVQTPEFSDFLIDGRRPDGTIEWALSGIDCALREATAELAIGGWTKLDDAVAFIVERYPGRTPRELSVLGASTQRITHIRFAVPRERR